MRWVLAAIQKSKAANIDLLLERGETDRGSQRDADREGGSVRGSQRGALRCRERVTLRERCT